MEWRCASPGGRGQVLLGGVTQVAKPSAPSGLSACSCGQFFVVTRSLPVEHFLRRPCRLTSRCRDLVGTILLATGTKCVWHMCDCCHSFCIPLFPSNLLSATFSFQFQVCCVLQHFKMGVPGAEVRTINTCLRCYSLYNKNIKYFFLLSKRIKIGVLFLTPIQCLPSFTQMTRPTCFFFLIFQVFFVQKMIVFFLFFFFF